jgi:hypothetical protein
MSNSALILDLAADLQPVRRRSMAREALALLALAAAEALLIVALGLLRPDMGQIAGSPYMAWKVGSLAILAVITGTAAVRSFSPPASPRRGLTIALAAAGLAIATGTIVASTADSHRGLLARLMPAHGLLCAVSIIVLALPLLAALGLAMRRAAPTDHRASALAAGLAAGITGALVFTLCCPMNDPLYIVVWYCVGCAVVAALGRWLLPRRFRL